MRTLTPFRTAGGPGGGPRAVRSRPEDARCGYGLGRHRRTALRVGIVERLVVRCVLGRPKSFWLDLHGALRADDHALHRHRTALRHSADLPATVSTLRVCDVVLWMHHRADHQRRSCVGT
ncbi:DUF6308 family protein [Streptomyces sp. NPDC059445]|uniref:DUF6308 family protein n=1 Tax=Streptomyces sp. NPDC059445 TaxID=3346832 RepID=UPI0036B52A41